MEESEDREKVGCDVILNKATDLDGVTSTSDQHDLQRVNETTETYITEVIEEANFIFGHFSDILFSHLTLLMYPFHHFLPICKFLEL